MGSRWTRLGRTLGGFIDAVIPCGCAICGSALPADRPPLCALCASRLGDIPRPTCERCGLTRVIESGGTEGCTACNEWPSGLRAASACLHEGPASLIVHGLKYRGWTALAAPMADRLLQPALRLAGTETPLLVPVPLSAARRRERGFNQAELLAAELSVRTGWPLRDLLERRAGGPAFAGLGRTERASRAAGAFAAVRSDLHDGGEGPAVLLVDDVITTGATAGACVAALAIVGIRCVGAVSFARTGRTVERA